MLFSSWWIFWLGSDNKINLHHMNFLQLFNKLLNKQPNLTMVWDT